MKTSKRQVSSGFTLVELLLALAAGLVVAGAVVQGLLLSCRLSQTMGRQLRQQEFAQRALRLVESDLRRAGAISADPASEPPACNLGGRTPVLHLRLATDQPPITYSQGAPPSAIWGGQVLMRCGPAFGIDGAQNLEGAWQNRVVLDGLEEQQALLEQIQRRAALGG
ncbi:prepilin-type N-terminal cleavage/methylation domain-containing protein [Cyanobium sp. Morenito 9A2]|uniref:prepilin-type N-terminal cleavage/methylation domain-containing protein n=1 Tax=Cyanobium sp. Morenito 9A2 TaxID=2823718 RepID=UPI0020CBFAB7|nr:prepilin-type N-terminal cleavage/methylation domain-containing protein [Cyanobium sp. Morenito 9A2]MCP9848802.1 prepilin-type N-terminal cleavage/methylation domain-containing protein [Cyanobium sp. Morenito 9A2]